MEAAEVIVSARTLLYQWKNAQDKVFDTSLGFMTQVDGAEHWSVLTEDMIKVNNEATLFEASHYFSYAVVARVVARDQAGRLVEVVSRCKQGSTSPELAKAIGIREALSWIKIKDWRNIVI